MRQPLPIWCGLTFGRWMKLLLRGPKIEAVYWRRLAAVTGMSVINSVLAAVERVWLGRRLREATVARPPVFILGHWRSGTTLLQEFLALDEQFVTPNLFQCSFPEHFRLSQRWLAPLTAWMQPQTRPMDAMVNGWNAPAEEEIALSLLTLSSPYLVSLFPSQPEKCQRFENLSKGLTADELTQWKRAYREFLSKLMLNSDRTPLLKSPANTARIPLLLEMFPDAKFIHIVRDPRAVFSSTRHLHQVLTRQNSFTSAEPVDLDERILSAYQSMYQSYHLYRVRIPADRRVELRFEDLEQDPEGELRKIYEHLKLPGWDSFSKNLAGPLARHRTFQKNRYHLSDDDRRRVIERWEPAFVRYGYSVENSSAAVIEPASDQASPSWSRS